jgi:hypothetical protein
MEPVNIEIRHAIIHRKKSDETLKEISESLQVPYRTVVNIWQKYKDKVLTKMGADYAKCGLHQVKRYSEIKSKCISLKISHPRWGTPRIHLEATKLYPQANIPCIRTLHSWYKQENLIKPNHKENEPSIGRAKAVHNIWQIDAKERLTLIDKQDACYLTIVDDKSGACLEALVFSLSPYQSSSRN